MKSKYTTRSVSCLLPRSAAVIVFTQKTDTILSDICNFSVVVQNYLKSAPIGNTLTYKVRKQQTQFDKEFETQLKTFLSFISHNWKFSVYHSLIALFEPRHNKTNKMSVRPAKTQISLGMQAATSSIPTSGTFFRGDLVMKNFLRSFSLFR